MGVSDGALVVLPYGGSFGDGGAEDLPHELAEVDSLLGGVRYIVVFSFASGLCDASLLLGLVTDRAAATCEQLAGA
jgi:hypothetical protein